MLICDTTFDLENSLEYFQDDQYLNDSSGIFSAVAQNTKPLLSQRSDRADSKSEKEGSLRGKILLVDDEVNLRQILHSILESYGLDVVSLSNGKQAYEYLINNHMDVDLVISDIKMPIMGGTDLALAVKAFNSFKGAFVFITGDVVPQLADYDCLVDGILTKPFKEDEMISKVKQWLSNC